MATMLFERVGNLLVLVHGHENPSDHEWNAYVECTHASQRSSSAVTGLLVTTLGGSPNATQRKAIVTAAEPTLITTCVCTDSVVARGIITAISWLYAAPMHSLRLHDVDGALDRLDVPPHERAAVKSVVERLQAQFR